MKIQPGPLLSLLIAMLISCTALQPTSSVPPQPIPTPPEERPEDFSILYKWSEGTIAPPYYYQYSIKINSSGQGEIQLIPNYSAEDDQVPVWNETFSVSQQELDGLYQLMRSGGLWTQNWQDLGGPPPGAGSESMVVTASGVQVQTPTYVNDEQNRMLAEIYAAVNALVPKDIWEKLMTQRDEYIEEHKDL
jgi:hypothetical protein